MVFQHGSGHSELSQDPNHTLLGKNKCTFFCQLLTTALLKSAKQYVHIHISLKEHAGHKGPSYLALVEESI